jgi:hypothetical protein
MLLPSHNAISIRNATINDIPEITILFNEYRIFYKQQDDIHGAQKFLTQRIERNECVLLLAEEVGVACGFTQLYPILSSVIMPRTWLLNDLFVAEMHPKKE